MSKLKYRLQLVLENNGSKQEERDTKITTILSTTTSIESDNPLPIPSKTSTLEVDGEDFILSDIKYKYVVEDGIVYYTTILSLSKKKSYKTDADYSNILKEYLNEHVDVKKWR